MGVVAHLHNYAIQEGFKLYPNDSINARRYAKSMFMLAAAMLEDAEIVTTKNKEEEVKRVEHSG